MLEFLDTDGVGTPTTGSGTDGLRHEKPDHRNLDRLLLPLVIALQRIPEKIETELAKAPPAKKWRLRERAEFGSPVVSRAWGRSARFMRMCFHICDLALLLP